MEPKHQKWASAYFNGDFIAVSTRSGYRGTARDPQGCETHLSPDASNETLGRSVLDAVACSRFLKLDEIDDFFNLERTTLAYTKWVASLLERYKYKTRRALFKSMALCHITVTTGTLEIAPMRHEKLEAWSGKRNDGVDNILLPLERPPEEIGKALRIAFSRCE